MGPFCHIFLRQRLPAVDKWRTCRGVPDVMETGREKERDWPRRKMRILPLKYLHTFGASLMGSSSLRATAQRCKTMVDAASEAIIMSVQCSKSNYLHRATGRSEGAQVSAVRADKKEVKYEWEVPTMLENWSSSGMRFHGCPHELLTVLR